MDTNICCLQAVLPSYPHCKHQQFPNEKKKLTFKAIMFMCLHFHCIITSSEHLYYVFLAT